jgi:hypothetical protein
VPRPADAPQASFEPVESASRRFLVPHEGYGQDPIFSQHASVEATKAARGIQDGSITSLGQLWETLTRERYEFQKARGGADPAFGFNRATGSHVDANQTLRRDWLTRENQLATPFGGDPRYEDYIPKAAEKADRLAARIPGAPGVPAGDESVVKKFFVDPSGDPAVMQEFDAFGSGTQGLARHSTHGNAAALFQSAEQMYGLAMSGALDRQETVEALARMYYRLANGMPNLRGSAAVAHETLVAAGRAVGIEFPPMAPGKVLDLEAITAPTEDEFVREFTTYLNGPIEFRGGPGR